jgi:hypothetical protein
MANNIAQLIIQHVDERDNMIIELTDNIFKLISNNIISAFNELIQLPPDNVDWVGIELSSTNDIEGERTNIDDMNINITFIITYYNSQASQYVSDAFGCDGEDDVENVKIITFWIPLAYCNANKQTIINFIMGVLPTVELYNDERDYGGFDASKLSPTQQQSLVQLAHCYIGTMQ